MPTHWGKNSGGEESSGDVVTLYSITNTKLGMGTEF
jgi:hypothetical protein